MNQDNQSYNYRNQRGSLNSEELSSLSHLHSLQGEDIEAAAVADRIEAFFGICFDDNQIRLLGKILTLLGEAGRSDPESRQLLAARECILLSGESSGVIDDLLAETAGYARMDRVHQFLRSIEEASLPPSAKESLDACAIYSIGRFASCFSDSVFFPQHRAFLMAALAELAAKDFGAALRNLRYAPDARSRSIDDRLAQPAQLLECFVNVAMKKPLEQVAKWPHSSPLWQNLEGSLRDILV